MHGKFDASPEATINSKNNFIKINLLEGCNSTQVTLNL